MGFVKKIGKSLFGGSSGSAAGYQSPYMREYDTNTRSGLYNRAGAGVSYDEKGNAKYDFSKVGQQISGPEGIAKATSGYDYSPIDQAINAYRGTGGSNGRQRRGLLIPGTSVGQPTYNANLHTAKYTSNYAPTNYTSSYKPSNYTPSTFNFKSLPGQYYGAAYDSGAKNIDKSLGSNIARTAEKLGTRNPGLLLRNSEALNRQAGEQRQDLASDLAIKQMELETNLDKESQVANAEEKYRAAGFNDAQARALADEEYRQAQFSEDQSRFKAGEGQKEFESAANLENRRADERFRNVQAMENAAKGKIASQAGQVEAERTYQDRALEYLMQQLHALAGSNQGTPGKQSLFSKAIGTAAKVAPFFL